MGDRGSASHMRSLGITQRATPLDTPWTGDLRVRFTDFQVNEITPDGSVLHLRKIGVGEDQTQHKEKEEKAEVKSSNGADTAATKPEDDQPQSDVPSISDEDKASLAALAGEQFVKDVVDMFQSSGDKDAHRKRATAESTDDRSKRGKIHHEVRRIFNSMIETSTDESGAIVAALASRRGRKRGRGGAGGGGRREEKPSGDYLHFSLCKDNRDTMDAINQIARMLRVKPQVIGYAGTKDRRASTVQRCSVRYARPAALSGTNNRLRGVVTGDYEYARAPIHLGQLRGNEFVIVIKNCRLTGDEAADPTKTADSIRASAQSALDHMTQHGWINYFGHQRFGTHTIGTHEIGKLILGDKFEDAVKALLSYDPEMAKRAQDGEQPEEISVRDDLARHYACMLFMTGEDPDRANEIIPRRYSAEVCVLRHLNRGGAQSRKDFVGALVHITRGLRSMYLHAYQSHVWNHAASRRWELHGAKVVKGDLVVATEEEVAPVNTEPEKDQDGDEVITPATQIREQENNGDDDDADAPLRARPLTEEEAASGRYTIYDVVLPSPGYEVVYPDNEIGDFYREFMARPENGGLDPLQMRRKRREFSLPGRYRRLVNRFLAPPSLEVRPYADDMEQMHPTDLDRLRNGEDGPATKKARTTDEKDGGDVKTEDAQAPEEKKADKVAAIVRFQLGSSAYATVTLRELMGDAPST